MARKDSAMKKMAEGTKLPVDAAAQLVAQQKAQTPAAPMLSSTQINPVENPASSVVNKKKQ